MDVPSHSEVVEQIDSFLRRHDMAPTRLGRDALAEPQFVTQVRAGREPSLTKLGKLFEFMRERDGQLVMAAEDDGAEPPRHRLSAGTR